MSFGRQNFMQEEGKRSMRLAGIAGKRDSAVAPTAGLAGWLLERMRRRPEGKPRLALLERITLAPRQTLALVEAEGRRILVATSPEGAPTFYALDGTGVAAGPARRSSSAKAQGRVQC